jgi:hypothetical protein
MKQSIVLPISREPFFVWVAIRSPIRISTIPPSARLIACRLSSCGRVPFPALGAAQLCRDLFEWLGEDRLHELVSDLADGFRFLPSVQFFGSAISVDDDIIHVAIVSWVSFKLAKSRSAVERRGHLQCQA